MSVANSTDTIEYFIQEPFEFYKKDHEINDKFNTQNLVQKFIKNYLYLEEKEDAFEINKYTRGAVGLVSEVGSGKSHFLTLLYDELRKSKNFSDKDKYKVVYIDISKYQFENDILLPILYEMYAQLKKDNKDTDVAKVTLEFVSEMIDYLPDNYKVFDFLKQGKKLYQTAKKLIKYKEGWDNIFSNPYRKDYNQFKNLVKEIESQQVYIIIDNFEKTKPEFVVNALFRMKELFENFDRWLFILSYDKKEIENALKTFYGKKFNTIGFFRKFIFTEFMIDRYYSSSQYRFNHKELNLFLFKNKKRYRHFISIRLLELFLKKWENIENDLSHLDEIKKDVIAYLILLKLIDEKAYKNLYEAILFSDNEFFNVILTNSSEILETIKNCDSLRNYKNINEIYNFDNMKEAFSYLELIN